MASRPVPAKKKPTTATDDPQEAAIKPNTENDQVEGDSYKIVMNGTTPSLSGTCDLQFQVGLNDLDDLYVRIHSSSGTGHYSRQWISLDEVWKCLTDWPHDTVTALVIFPMFRNRSINTAGYVTSALLDISLLTPSQEKARHFDLVDDDRFSAIVADLKATHSSPAKRKPKAKA